MIMIVVIMVVVTMMVVTIVMTTTIKSMTIMMRMVIMTKYKCDKMMMMMMMKGTCPSLMTVVTFERSLYALTEQSQPQVNLENTGSCDSLDHKP